MSYTPLPNAEPPAYADESYTPRVVDDNIPDVSKYSTNVAECLDLRQIIRNVISFLTLQILGTVVVGLIISTSPTINQWCFNNTWLLIVSIIGSFGFLIGTYFTQRSYPTNLIFRGGLTLLEAYIWLRCLPMIGIRRSLF